MSKLQVSECVILLSILGRKHQWITIEMMHCFNGCCDLFMTFLRWWRKKSSKERSRWPPGSIQKFRQTFVFIISARELGYKIIIIGVVASAGRVILNEKCVPCIAVSGSMLLHHGQTRSDQGDIEECGVILIIENTYSQTTLDFFCQITVSPLITNVPLNTI